MHGIRCSKYGAHLFHTQYERVWDYAARMQRDSDALGRGNASVWGNAGLGGSLELRIKWKR